MDQVFEYPSLQSFGNGIWTMNGDVVHMFRALPFTTRMTIVKLSSGSLWLHSPIAPTPERQHIIDQLGTVEHLVAPNKIHSLGIEPWHALYPSATVWGSPEFSSRHPKIAVDTLLHKGTATAWESELDFQVIEGHAFLDEVVFLHKPSKSLIITDLIQKHYADQDTWFWRGTKRLVGISGKQGGTSLDIKMSVRNRNAMRTSIEQMLEWDFDNLIISHGHCLAGGAKEDVERAFNWITKHT